ncbi:MAG: hypothetical protein FWC60_01490 [Firmicutes bacterium]|nr:hypothetical protein [Bacillota bacterium]
MKITRQTRSSGWRLLFILACLLPVLWLLAGNATAEQATGGKDDGTCRNDYSQCFKERLPIQEMRAVAYTAAFAKRFGLPPPAPGTEPDNGLEALEVRVQRAVEWTNFYSISLSLYVDNRLPIKLPESGHAGSRRMLNRAYRFILDPFNSHKVRGQVDKWQAGDRNYKFALETKYLIPVYLGTMDDHVEGGGHDSIECDEYYTELLPGLAYIRLQSYGGVVLYASLRKNLGDFGIFLRRPTAQYPPYGHFNDPNEFIRFKLPDHILTRIKEWIVMMKPVNADAMKEFNKIQAETNK